MISSLINLLRCVLWWSVLMNSPHELDKNVHSAAVGWYILNVRVKVIVTQRCPTFFDPMNMEFPRQEYWIGLPFPLPKS